MCLFADVCANVGSIANVCVLGVFGVSHNYRAICSKMGYRTDVPV